MKTIVVTLLTSAAMMMIGSAQAASEMDTYIDCWSSVVRKQLNETGYSEQDLKRAVENGDNSCVTQREAAAREETIEDVDEMRRYMEVAFYRANTSPDSNRTDPVKPQPIGGVLPDYMTNEDAVYNVDTVVLCETPGMLDKAWALAGAGQHAAVAALPGCTVTDEGVELVRIREIGWKYMEATWVAGGHTVDLWVRPHQFKYPSLWESQCRSRLEMGWKSCNRK